MLILEYKIDAMHTQYARIEEAIRIVQFIRNKCLRKWQDERGVSRYDLNVACARLANDYPFAGLLNSQARQAAAERAWFAIERFYEKCQLKKQGLQKGKCGYPRFQQDNRSVEYKTTGWRLDPDGKHITFTDGCQIGRVRLVGTRAIMTFPVKQIKRVRLLRRADGYYCQFAVSRERVIEHVPTGKHVGIDMGLKSFLTDSLGNTVENPRYLRKAEKKLKRLHRRLSKTHKKSKNRAKARQKLAKAYLKVQRQREDFARKTASAVVTSSDLIAFEDLKIRNLIRNRHLSKSISDAAWGIFRRWLTYYATMHHIPALAVAPHFTSQNCSACGTVVKKSLSVRTHVCPACGVVLDRDENAAVNILNQALCCTQGHWETGSLHRGE